MGLAEGGVQVVHPFGEIRLGRFDNQVVVVHHQTIGVARPLEAIESLAQEIQKLAVVPIVVKDPLASVSARGDMIDGAGKLNAQWSCHHPYPKENSISVPFCLAARRRVVEQS